MIDLHSHTTASDGQHAPRALVALAHAAGIRTLAVTDHDTVAGLEEAALAARELGMALVPGIELSAFVHGREVHVLGHFLRPGDLAIAHFAQKLKDERRTRMEAMVQKLRDMGYPVRMEEVVALAGPAHLARPHLARVLVEKRLCTDVKDAFDRLLGDGKPAFVPRFKLTGQDAVALIRGAGGTATVAHAAVSRLDRHDIAALKEAGLAGLEVIHSDHDPGARERLLGLSRELDLVPTAGSDFHGEKINPGRRLGNVTMDGAALERLRARAG